MAMMRAATDAFMPNSSKRSSKPASGSNDEIAALRKQMAEMQKKLDELSK